MIQQPFANDFSDIQVVREYEELCNYAARLMSEENITFTWALLQFEQTARPHRVLEVLTGAVKTTEQLERDVRRLIWADKPCKLGSEFREIDLVEAMKLFMEDIPVYVEWEKLQLVKKSTWCEMNVNHLQAGKWYVKVNQDGM
ncbi:hypothetical protein [Paenibacillus ihuae]|uniref:hypothetical protein n=1 Tax=Paenibacillus ihuae TaxID=1232431 RepID=UPI0006D52DA9|nr:hypothetical protein [Paenibacillus ihuae]